MKNGSNMVQMSGNPPLTQAHFTAEKNIVEMTQKFSQFIKYSFGLKILLTYMSIPF
jgi:hypothetical protein